MREPVVITGMGILACNGMGREDYWDALVEGRSGIRHIDRFDPSELPCQIAGQLWDFDPADFMKKADVRRWNRHVHQAVACSRFAVDDADLESANYEAERMAVAIGTSVGTPDEAFDFHREAFEARGWKGVDRFASSAFAGHSATVNVSVNFGLRGPAITIASGCATGLDVIAWGMHEIQAGRADAALVGATESPIFELGLAGACSLGILSRNNDDPAGAMRPFDAASDGIVLSEGVAAVVLERADNAIARGARIFAEVAGNGSAAEGKSPLILDKDGRALARAITVALKEAGMQPHEIDAAQCHGVSLPMYDRSETQAYKRALGDHAYRIPISATKSMTGQPYSAGGIMSVVSAICAFEKGLVSPTINLEHPHEDCDLDYVPSHSRMNDVSSALVTSISFGGTHSATVLRRYN